MLDRVRRLKARLRQGKIVYSAWVTFNDVGVAEVVAGAGYDAVLSDSPYTKPRFTPPPASATLKHFAQ